MLGFKIKHPGDVAKLKYQSRYLSPSDFDILGADKDYELQIREMEDKLHHLESAQSRAQRKLDEAREDASVGIKDADKRVKELENILESNSVKIINTKKYIGELQSASVNINQIHSAIKGFILRNNFLVGISEVVDAKLRGKAVPKDAFEYVSMAKRQRLAVGGLLKELGL